MAKKKDNKKVRPFKLKIKKGDMVYVTSGDYKDTSQKREVLEIFPLTNKAIVEGVNMVKRHTKPTQNSEGGIIEKPAPIHISNLMLADPRTGDPTRVGRKKTADGKSVRYSIKSGEIIN